MLDWVSLPVQDEKRCAVSPELLDWLNVFMLKGDDQGQNKYRRKVNEAWERESKVVGLKCLWTTNMQNTWNRLWCRNCLIELADLLSCCFLKLSKSGKTNAMNIDFNTTFLTHTRKKVLKYLKYRRTIIYSDMHSWKIKCKVVAKLFNILQSFYLLTFRLKSAPSNRYLFLPLLYQTPVNKSESFNDRLKWKWNC